MVDSLFDVLLAMFMRNVLRDEWDTVEHTDIPATTAQMDQGANNHTPKGGCSWEASTDDDCDSPAKHDRGVARGNKELACGKLLKKYTVTRRGEYNSKNLCR